MQFNCTPPAGPALKRTTDDEVLGVLGDEAPLLDCEFVDAVCRSIKTVQFAIYKQTRLVFTFEIVAPKSHQGKKLQMFVRQDPRWKFIPRSSKLHDIAIIAIGTRRMSPKITKSMFQGKVFRCRVKNTGGRSIVDTIVEKLTGS